MDLCRTYEILRTNKDRKCERNTYTFTGIISKYPNLYTETIKNICGFFSMINYFWQKINRKVGPPVLLTRFGTYDFWLFPKNENYRHRSKACNQNSAKNSKD